MATVIKLPSEATARGIIRMSLTATAVFITTAAAAVAGTSNTTSNEIRTASTLTTSGFDAAYFRLHYYCCSRYG